MFIEDIKNDFYNVLLGNRVLLLVHYDVDAICTCKILQGLFKCDNVSYTLVPVGGISELKQAYEENNEEIKYVVLINCGGTIDLVDILQPEEDVVFFVLDAHKPTDVCNVYSDGQVRLVYKDDEENIPNYDDIFRDDDEDENETQESGHEGLEAMVERRRERRAWEDRRNNLMFNYIQFSYYGKPSACIAVELAWRVSRCGWAAVWAASVAAAAQTALHSRTQAAALLDADSLHRHLPPEHSQTGARVCLEKDACLPLYRRWSLEAALRHAPALAPHLRLHTLAGHARLRQLLADCGIPLQQARQAYRSMDVELRHSLLTALETAAPKHKLPIPTHTTFLLQRPHSPTLAAMDDVYAIMGLIEHETTPKGEGFQLALSVLDIESGENESRRLGSLSAQRALEAVGRVVHATLSGKKLHLAGPFSYFIIPEGTPEAQVVKGPLWLGVAARWASAASGGARALVASAPHGDRACLLLGVPPRYSQEPRKSVHTHSPLWLVHTGDWGPRLPAAGRAAALLAGAAQVSTHTLAPVARTHWGLGTAPACCWACRRATRRSRASQYTHTRPCGSYTLGTGDRACLLLGVPPRYSQEPRKSVHTHSPLWLVHTGDWGPRLPAAGRAAALLAGAAQVSTHTLAPVARTHWGLGTAPACCWACRRATRRSRASQYTHTRPCGSYTLGTGDRACLLLGVPPRYSQEPRKSVHTHSPLWLVHTGDWGPRLPAAGRAAALLAGAAQVSTHTLAPVARTHWGLGTAPACCWACRRATRRSRASQYTHTRPCGSYTLGTGDRACLLLGVPPRYSQEPRKSVHTHSPLWLVHTGDWGPRLPAAGRAAALLAGAAQVSTHTLAPVARTHWGLGTAPACCWACRRATRRSRASQYTHTRPCGSYTLGTGDRACLLLGVPPRYSQEPRKSVHTHSPLWLVHTGDWGPRLPAAGRAAALLAGAAQVSTHTLAPVARPHWGLGTAPACCWGVPPRYSQEPRKSVHTHSPLWLVHTGDWGPRLPAAGRAAALLAGAAQVSTHTLAPVARTHWGLGTAPACCWACRRATRRSRASQYTHTRPCGSYTLGTGDRACLLLGVPPRYSQEPRKSVHTHSPLWLVHTGDWGPRLPAAGRAAALLAGAAQVSTHTLAPVARTHWGLGTAPACCWACRRATRRSRASQYTHTRPCGSYTLGTGDRACLLLGVPPRYSQEPRKSVHTHSPLWLVHTGDWGPRLPAAGRAAALLAGAAQVSTHTLAPVARTHWGLGTAPACCWACRRATRRSRASQYTHTRPCGSYTLGTGDRACLLLGVPPRYSQEPRKSVHTHSPLWLVHTGDWGPRLPAAGRAAALLAGAAQVSTHTLAPVARTHWGLGTAPACCWTFLFGAAFEQAANKCGASVSLNHVDSSIISVPIAQRAQFLDALTALLA
ncbi:unnamed protein product [Arctia plantaginis]|uniref:Cell division control protein 45 n=1 Tax=Arctia plantaginis TaxID=874455 RepID=A0A8S0YR41_ARCPL|nr:unnamed protein product [Arctia plantaginis]